MITRKERRRCKPEYEDPELNCVIDASKLNETELEEQERIKEELENILVTETDGIDLSEILTDKLLNGGFYSYEGSLTTPPCTDDVRWFNMQTPSYISKNQIKRYRKITRPCKFDDLIAPNWRPLQENINTVFTCSGNPDSNSGGDGNKGDSDSDSSSSDSSSSDDSDDAVAIMERPHTQIVLRDDNETFWNRYKELMICVLVAFVIGCISICCLMYRVWNMKHQDLNPNAKQASPAPIAVNECEMQQIINVDSEDSSDDE